MFLMFGVLTSVCISETLRYTFSGVISNFSSNNKNILRSDLDLRFGGRSVTYIFDIDFTRRAYWISTSTGTWNYFYAEQIGEGLMQSTLGGYSPKGSSLPYNVYYSNGQRTGRLFDGSGVVISLSSMYSDDWAVDDWEVGDVFPFTDSTYVAEGAGWVYALGNVTLGSITAIPEPAHSGILLAAFIGICSVLHRRNRN